MCVFFIKISICVLFFVISNSIGQNANLDNNDNIAEQKIFNFKRWGNNKCLSRDQIQVIIEKYNLPKIKIAKFDNVAKNATLEINMAVNKEDNQISLPPLLPIWFQSEEFDYLISHDGDIELIKSLQNRYKMSMLDYIEERLNRLKMILKKKIGARISVLRTDGRYYKGELYEFLTDVGFGPNGYTFYSYRQLQQAKDEIAALSNTLGIYWYKDLQEYLRSDINKIVELLNSDTLLTHRVLSVKGERGYDGAPGTKGFKGFKGNPGSPGKIGDTGDKGDKGERGRKGMKGIKGIRYDLKGDDQGEFLFEYEKKIYFDNLQCKTQNQESWTVYEKNQFGPKGLKGVQGQKGDRGTIGEKGLPGNDAIVREVVFQGQPGRPGKQGYSNCNKEQRPQMEPSVRDKFWFGKYRVLLRQRVEVDRLFSRLNRLVPNLKNKIKRFFDLTL